jgi:predicted ATP-dependent serine protease
VRVRRKTRTQTDFAIYNGFKQISLEGMRAMTVEVQALVTMSSGDGNYGGRRTVNGVAYARLLLQARCIH